MNQIAQNSRQYNRFLSRFVWSWILSFPLKRLAFGLPFLVTLGFFAVVFARGDGEIRRQQFLQGQLRNALAKDDLESARLILFRRLQANPTNIDSRYQMGQVLDELGRRDEAMRWMRPLAFPEAAVSAVAADDADTDPETKESDSPETTTAAPSVDQLASIRRRFRTADARAARWMVVKHYLPQLPDGLSDRDNADYTDLLDWLYLTAPRDTELAKLYAEQLLRVRRFADALPILVQLMPESPGIGLKAAVISRGLGYETRAVGYARQSLDEFTRLREKEPSRADLAVALAECHLFLNQYSEAASVLRHALELNQDEKQSEQLRNLLAHSFVIWANSFARKPQKTVTDRLQSLKLLQNALTVAPNHPLVLQMVADQVLEVIDETDSEIVALRQSLVLGTSPGVSHFIQGTAAVLKGDIQAAEMHLEIASKTLPLSDVILNNLACVIYQKEGGDLERALALSETAIKRNPNPAPHYLETRGQILRKLGRWIDAIPDLEAALTVPSLAAEAHRGLAECFEKLGDKELSEQHRQAAERIARAPKSS